MVRPDGSTAVAYRGVHPRKYSYRDLLATVWFADICAVRISNTLVLPEDGRIGSWLADDGSCRLEISRRGEKSSALDWVSAVDSRGGRCSDVWLLSIIASTLAVELVYTAVRLQFIMSPYSRRPTGR